MNTKWEKWVTWTLVFCLTLGLLMPLTARADQDNPLEQAQLVWDMEQLPEDLFAADVAWDIEGTSGGPGNGYVNAVRAAGKGADGSTAAAITLTESCPLSALWANGTYLRIDQDETAVTDWSGIRQLWFWADISEFANSDLYLDFMIDGVYPEINQPFYLYQGGKLTEKKTEATYDGAVFGRLGLPKGYVGWVGIEASAFAATFGIVQCVGFNIAAISGEAQFPLSMYVDEFRVVYGETDKGALEGEGELFNSSVPEAAAKLYTDVTDVYQKVESFGASGAWWTTGYGEKGPFVDKLLKLVFTDEGAGLNNYRHNIGGSVKEDLSDAGTGMTFQRKTYSPLTEEGTYDEDRDIGAYTVLMKLKDMGTIDDFTLFINSPPSSMTKSGMTYGDEWEDSPSNLREDCYEAFASYVVDMVQLYNYLGIPVKYISPINEPQYDWVAPVQEGCHYDAKEALEVWRLIARELKERAKEDSTIAGVRISPSESGYWADKSFVNYVYLQLATDPELAEMVDHVCSHSYASNADGKKRLWEEMRSVGSAVQFRQTEYGPALAEPDFTITTALDVARVIYEDISILHVDGWSYWLAAANGSFTDGLVYFNPESESLMPSKRLWAMGQYARFVKGAYQVNADEYGMPKAVKSTAYVNGEDNTLVYVMVNEGKNDEAFSFAGLPKGSKAEVYETSKIRNLEKRGTMTADCGYVLPAESITTFVFHDVELSAIASGDHPDNPMGHPAKEDFDYSVFTGEKAKGDTTTENNQPKESGGVPVWLYVLYGACILVAAGIIAVVILGKKKEAAASDPEKMIDPGEESEE